MFAKLATCGAAIEVPLTRRQRSQAPALPPPGILVPSAVREAMSVPGAARSIPVPQLLKDARRSPVWVAATLSTGFSVPADYLPVETAVRDLRLPRRQCGADGPRFGVGRFADRGGVGFGPPLAGLDHHQQGDRRGGGELEEVASVHDARG